MGSPQTIQVQAKVHDALSQLSCSPQPHSAPRVDPGLLFGSLRVVTPTRKQAQPAHSQTQDNGSCRRRGWRRCDGPVRDHLQALPVHPRGLVVFPVHRRGHGMRSDATCVLAACRLPVAASWPVFSALLFLPPLSRHPNHCCQVYENASNGCCPRMHCERHLMQPLQYNGECLCTICGVPICPHAPLPV